MSANFTTRHVYTKSESAEARRRAVRYFTAAVSGLTAVMYFLIGLHVVSVVEGGVDQSWGLAAGAAYAFGAVLLVAFDQRIVWVLGAILQIFVILTYFRLAPQRIPAYEVWGILIRVAQFVILITLTYLVFRQPIRIHDNEEI